MKKNLTDMTTDALKSELVRIREKLCDIQDMHSFTFEKTSVHIGAEMAQNMQSEFEQECMQCNEEIAEIEAVLKERGAA